MGTFGVILNSPKRDYYMISPLFRIPLKVLDVPIKAGGKFERIGPEIVVSILELYRNNRQPS